MSDPEQDITQLVNDLQTERDAQKNTNDRIDFRRRKLAQALGLIVNVPDAPPVPAPTNGVHKQPKQATAKRRRRAYPKRLPNGTRKDLVLAFLGRQKGPAKSERIADAIGCPRASLSWYLIQLKNEGKVESTGARGYWTLA